MALDLEEAIERARLLADDTGILAQESYDLLVSKIDDTDLHAFTMALVDSGIRPRTSAKYKEYRAKLARFLGAQAVPADVWDAMDKEPVGVADEEVRGILENAGISVSSDGTVKFYRSNIPGIYSDKLPQSLDLDTAIRLWEQQLQAADNERSRIHDFQDTLTTLRQQVEQRKTTRNSPTLDVINSTLSNLESYGYSDKSRSETIRGLSQALEAVFDSVMSNNWFKATSDIDLAQETLEDYDATQYESYERNLYIWDALDRLQGLQSEDPQSFAATVKGLGGVIAKLMAYIDRDRLREDFSPETKVVVNVPTRFVKDVVAKYSDIDANFAVSFMANDFDNLRDLEKAMAKEIGVDDVDLTFTDFNDSAYFEDSQKELEEDDYLAMLEILERVIAETLSAGDA